MKHTLANYAAGYAMLWRDLAIRPEYRATVAATAHRILASRARYESVSAATGVPWFVVALIHKMEADLDFTKHLHNGDSLAKRTWQVPAGRPVKGSAPFTWEESAIDAIGYDGLDRIKSWRVEDIAFAFEKYNGWGYRKRAVPSAYLWSYSTAYTSGKFIRDGEWSASAVSKQSGAMVILHALAQQSAEIRATIASGVAPAAVEIAESERDAPAKDRSPWSGRTVYGAVVAGIMATVAKVGAFFGLADGSALALIADIAAESDTYAAPLIRVATLIGANSAEIGFYAVAAAAFVVILARLDASKTGKVG
jgi:lysozyme family protein